MMDKYINALKRNKDVSAWKIVAGETKSVEAYYVMKNLETNRVAEEKYVTIVIYVDKNDKRGTASFNAYDYMDDAELDKKIAENVFAASFALNKFYELPAPREGEVKESESNMRDKDFSEVLQEVVDAVFAADCYEGGYLAATEFFLKETTERIINSRGIDVSSKSYSGNVELIPSWEDGEEEVEVYHMMKFESVDAADIKAEVDSELQVARARFNAVEVPDKNVKVILQDAEVGQVMGYFTDQLGYASIYQKMNRFDIGEKAQGDNVTGDLLTLSMVPYAKGASASRSFDGDGIILKEVEIIKDGVAVARHGSNRFGFYLGEKEPTGALPVIKCQPGSKSFKDMAKEPYIRCVKFSGLQVEPNSGYFGGEVRLGFYFDGEKEIPVTGFSISGDINKTKSTLRLSKETVTKSRYTGPKYMEVVDMTIM